jgi:4-hydroxy-3-methylbut-2-enyl diphosphate reductase
VVRDIEETQKLCGIILRRIPARDFYELFKNKHSESFDVSKDLQRVGVVNQTTMLATETQAIADLMRKTMIEKYGAQNIDEHFGDTSDTLCYATYDNQRATLGLIEGGADFAIVVGGYNSSNTSHIVELCEEKLPVYFISGADKILSADVIKHYNIHSHLELTTKNWLNRNNRPNSPPQADKKPVRSAVEIILTSGASCPDAILDEVLQKIVSYFPEAKSVDEALEPFKTEVGG